MVKKAARRAGPNTSLPVRPISTLERRPKSSKRGSSLRTSPQSTVFESLDSRETIPESHSDLVKSSSRVLDVLEFFQHVRRPAKEVEIRTALQLPKSSAHELLRTLSDRGYLTYDNDTRDYFLSFRMVGFGAWLSGFYFGSNRVLDLMSEISAETGETATLAMYNNHCMYLLTVMDSQERSSRMLLDGQKIPIVGSASGGAFLMTRPDGEVGDLARLSMAPMLMERNAPSVRFVIEKIREFRSQKYATSFGSRFADTLTIAIPLPKASGHVPLFLGIGGDKQAMETRERAIANAMFSAVARHLA